MKILPETARLPYFSRPCSPFPFRPWFESVSVTRLKLFTRFMSKGWGILVAIRMWRARWGSSFKSLRVAFQLFMNCSWAEDVVVAGILVLSRQEVEVKVGPTFTAWSPFSLSLSWVNPTTRGDDGKNVMHVSETTLFYTKGERNLLLCMSETQTTLCHLRLFCSKLCEAGWTDSLITNTCMEKLWVA